jgi:hypothetical protein
MDPPAGIFTRMSQPAYIKIWISQFPGARAHGSLHGVWRDVLLLNDAAKLRRGLNAADEIIYYLEMLYRSELRPARPSSVLVRCAGRKCLTRAESIPLPDVGAAYQWIDRLSWCENAGAPIGAPLLQTCRGMSGPPRPLL